MAKEVTLEKALETVEIIDSFSQSAFGKIKAIAEAALMAMETRSGALNVGLYAELFQAVHLIADDAEGCINTEAEGLGANYKDGGWMQRSCAQDAVRAGAGARVQIGGGL